MSEIRNTNLWQCDLVLHDYLSFASSKRGHLIEMGKYIHNYSLTYALGLANSAWHSEQQKPHYAQQLGGIRGVYMTPAKMVSGAFVARADRGVAYTYSSSDTQKKDYAVVKYIRPGGIFRFYLLTALEHTEFPELVRIGRLMAKARMTKRHPQEVEVLQGDFTSAHILNWNDITAEPKLCDVILQTGPSRLIENARFSGIRYIRARFENGDEVKLPFDMGYFRKELYVSWWKEAA